MDGENKGKPYCKWMIWEVKKTLFLETSNIAPELF